MFFCMEVYALLPVLDSYLLLLALNLRLFLAFGAFLILFAKMLIAPLPSEWSYEFAEEIVRDYVQRNFVDKGMYANREPVPF